MNAAAIAARKRAIDIELDTRRRKAEAIAPPVHPVTDSYGEWLSYARPTMMGKPVVWTAPHFVLMQTALDQVTAGAEQHVYFSIPIRHGKTEHNTIGYGSYRLEKNPATRIIICTYNDDKARKMSRDLKKLTKERGVKISLERDTQKEWETVAGGGVNAFGAGAGLASVNADLILIDDPIGKREDAESEVHRDRVWDWITNDILARCEPHTAVLFTMSRWHTEDPAGRLLVQQRGLWHVIDVPARAEPDDPLGRAENAPLWPELRGEEWLTNERTFLGEYGFASLLQGRPRPREGGMFKWDWWKLIDNVPGVGPMIRYWDLAGTNKKSRAHDPDFTSGSLLLRMEDKRTAVVDIERFQYSVARRDARMLEVARADRDTYQGRVVWWIETESGIQGTERTETLERNIQALGVACYHEHPTGSKVSRAEPLASAAESGNILLCGTRQADGTISASWINPFRSEAADFTGLGGHDDMIDSTDGAFSKLNHPTEWSQVRTTF